MFKLQDGRDHFWQWDSDRKLIIEDASITEVHFSNRTDDYSLVCETYVENGITLVNVPNILLQTDWRIHVYAVDGNYTKHEKCYEIIARTKPSDYVYTETEIINWQYIKTQLDSKADVLDLEKVEADLDNKKVDKVAGKGLSTNDYTDNDKAAVSGLDYALSSDNKSSYAINGYIEASEAQFGKLQVQGTDILATLENKANETELKRIKYYGDPDIIPSPESYFTVNETGETITGLTEAGKTQTELVIPYKINGVKITKLENGTISILAGATNKITKVVIPDSVTTIGDGAFDTCLGLTSVNIPNSVTSIGDGAFSYCTALTSIEIPNSVTNIGYSAFSNCTALTSINIPNRVTSIGNDAFNNCKGLTSITIPNSVTTIGNSAFVYCTGLKSITIPNSVTSIGDYAFYSCTELKSINIPNSVTTIGNEAFVYSTNLTIYCEQGSYAETYANTNNIPVKYTDISAIEFNNKADKATTLEGYGITDAYTKTEVEAYINETILGGAW